MKTIIKLITTLILGLSVSVADEVNRDSKESKERPHLLVTAKVEKIEHIEGNPNEANLMAASITIQSVQRRKTLDAPAEGTKIQIYFRTGRPQRPRLPVLEQGKVYNLYLRTMKIDGKEQVYLEFEDDVTLVKEPAK